MTPGESVQVQIQFQSTTTNPTINFQLNEADDSQPMDWASQEQALQIPTIPRCGLADCFCQLRGRHGNHGCQYHAVLAADATYLAQLGEPTNDVLQLLEFEIEKANAAYTAQTLVTVTPDDLPAPGMDLTFTAVVPGVDRRPLLPGHPGRPGLDYQLGHHRDHHEHGRRGHPVERLLFLLLLANRRQLPARSRATRARCSP